MKVSESCRSMHTKHGTSNCLRQGGGWGGVQAQLTEKSSENFLFLSSTYFTEGVQWFNGLFQGKL